MKRSTVEILSCPTCRSALSPPGGPGDAVIHEGSLVCTGCGRSFPIENGIARFVDPEDLVGPNRRFAGFYDRMAPVYDLFMKMALLPFGGDRKARREILDRLELGGERILEVSVGTGANLPYLFESPRVGDLFGLDISAGELERCRRIAAGRGWPVYLFLGTAETLPFGAETFDCVFHIGGINFFSDKKGAIDEMIRVARPGSKIVIADESERLANFMARIPGFSHPRNEGKPDTTMPVHLVPDTMEDIRVDGIWKAHGRHHGYCLEFRKPA